MKNKSFQLFQAFTIKKKINSKLNNRKLKQSVCYKFQIISKPTETLKITKYTNEAFITKVQSLEGTKLQMYEYLINLEQF